MNIELFSLDHIDFVSECIERCEGEIHLLEDFPAVLKRRNSNMHVYQAVDDGMFRYGIRNKDYLTVDSSRTPRIGDFVVLKIKDKYYIRIFSNLKVFGDSDDSIYTSELEDVAGVAKNCDRIT